MSETSQQDFGKVKLKPGRGVKRTNDEKENTEYTIVPTFEMETLLYSEADEVNNLGHIYDFLKRMLENESGPEKDEDDDKDVLKLIDVEEVISSHPQVYPFEQDEKMKKAISSLVSVIPGIFSRIIRCDSSADDNTLRSESIKDLSIIAQVLVYLVETTERKSYTASTEEIATMVKEKLYSPYKESFPFELITISPETLQHLAMLNTSLCFLFIKLIFSNDSCDPDWKYVQKYLTKFFEDKTYSDVKFNCIPLFIKMIQIFNYKTPVPDAIFHVLKQLVSFLKIPINHPNKEKLINFLYDMCIPAGYRFWFGSEPMKIWFDWLLSHLKEDVHKLDKKIGTKIRRISTIHVQFSNLLDFSVIKDLLNHNNEYYKETAIVLLRHMNIDTEVFHKIFDIIAMDSFPTKLAVSLVEALDASYHRKAQSEKAQFDYIQFLLSIAVGMHNIDSKTLLDVNTNSYTKAIKQVQKLCKFIVVPSLYWEVHSKLFNKCAAYLISLNQLHVTTMLTRLIKEILPPKKIIPIHCALAILKLEMDYKSQDTIFLEMMLELNFSCLMTRSVLTELPIEDEWTKWNISEHEASFLFTEEFALKLFKLLLRGDFSKIMKPDMHAVFFVLRLVEKIITLDILNYKSKQTVELVLRVLESLANNCTEEKSLKLQPLYIKLFEFFTNLQHAETEVLTFVYQTI